jgi:hypothetical protein
MKHKRSAVLLLSTYISLGYLSNGLSHLGKPGLDSRVTFEVDREYQGVFTFSVN